MLHGSPKNKRQIGLRVDPRTHKQIRTLAASLDLTNSEVVEQAVTQYADKLPLSSPASDATPSRGDQAPATDK